MSSPSEEHIFDHFFLCHIQLVAKYCYFQIEVYLCFCLTCPTFTILGLHDCFLKLLPVEWFLYLPLSYFNLFLSTTSKSILLKLSSDHVGPLLPRLPTEAGSILAFHNLVTSLHIKFSPAILFPVNCWLAKRKYNALLPVHLGLSNFSAFSIFPPSFYLEYVSLYHHMQIESVIGQIYSGPWWNNLYVLWLFSSFVFSGSFVISF